MIALVMGWAIASAVSVFLISKRRLGLTLQKERVVIVAARPDIIAKALEEEQVEGDDANDSSQGRGATGREPAP